MDQLWAPWRLSYVTNPKPTPTDGEPGDCFICRAVAEAPGRENLVVMRTHLSVVMLNRFPYNNGHLLIAPRDHKATPADLTDEETLDQQHLLQVMLSVLEAKLSSEGVNVGLNLGKAAGAGLPGHLHWHVVPRWAGDTNFMPVVADTRVIVQSLDALYTLLSVDMARSAVRCLASSSQFGVSAVASFSAFA